MVTYDERPAHVFTLEPLTKNQRHVLQETVPTNSPIPLRFGRREVYFEYAGEEERRGLLDIATNLFQLTLRGRTNNDSTKWNDVRFKNNF